MGKLKRCWDCQKRLLLDDFNKDKSRGDGLNAQCRKCARIESIRYFKNRKKERIEYSVKYYQDNRIRIRKKYVEYYQDNKEDINKKQAEYRKENKEKESKRGNKYRQNHKKEASARAAKRRAAKLNQTPHEADLKKIQLYYAICGETNEILGDTFFHIDHIQPLSKGGLHHEDNLQILEAELNIQKSDKWPLIDDEQIKYRGITL